MLDGLIGETSGLVPRGRCAVDPGDAFGTLDGDPSPEQLGEEMMEPPPRTNIVQRDEKSGIYRLVTSLFLRRE